MVRTRISHYSLLRKIGQGGMGEVYLADDLVLHRKVAIKLLSPKLNDNENARKRLLREAKAAAQLDHPNVCSIYEVGEDGGVSFIAMQYADGETLASRDLTKPLRCSKAVGIAIQVTDAVAAAHAHGILHRDIKPENIIIDSKEHVKVLDFGLAKKLEDEFVAADADTLSLVSQSGALIGTVPYMSPEQVRAEKLDGRSDIFSIGTLLYEMLSGTQPFKVRNAAQSIAAILTDNPQPLKSLRSDVPGELEHLVLKCLEKDKERRYQSAQDLLVDLKKIESHLKSGFPWLKIWELVHAVGRLWQRTVSVRWLVLALVTVGVLVTGTWYLIAPRGVAPKQPTSKPINSIAVLPFKNENADAEIEYLCDGLTESLLNSLSQLPNMKVIARNSAFHYQGRAIEPKSVGRELNVQALLLGRVVRRGEDYRIEMEIVDVADNSRVWGEQYDHTLFDLVSTQGQMIKSIVDKLRPHTGAGTEGVSKGHTENNETYQLYLKGRFHWNKRTVDGLEKAVEYFQEAILKDPNYALAYAGLADAYLVNSKLSPKETADRARTAALKALSLDNTLAEAHTSLGFVKARYDWKWSEAEKEYRRALELNPNYAVAYYFYEDYLVIVGKNEEALEVLKKAQEIDPLSIIVSAEMGVPLLFMHEYDRAIEQFQKTLDLDPNYWQAHYWLGVAYHQKGVRDQSISEFQKATTASGESPTALAMLGYAYASSGQKARALEILGRLNRLAQHRNVLPTNYALIYFGLDQKDEGFKWLDKSYEERDPSLVLIKLLPIFDNLRQDPRFSTLVKRLGLPN
jgi:TolB-like protein/Flp pilus assembly protein TadD/tRNA A-37 threonylcarbamoyl transferase component Bud32